MTPQHEHVAGEGNAGMKLLVSAYACEPGKGSEPAVGWNWVQALVRRGYQVHVITRSNNREAIESDAASRNPALSFHYYDLPLWARAGEAMARAGSTFITSSGNGCVQVGQEDSRCEHFDRVHHVTFASYRQPSFMGGLGIPFIFGPVGGGETHARRNCVRGLSMREPHLPRRFAILATALIALDPLMRSTFSRAQTIACTTPETMARIPASAIAPNAWCSLPSASAKRKSLRLSCEEPIAPHFLFVGRLLYWKGLHLALRALGQARQIAARGTAEDHWDGRGSGLAREPGPRLRSARICWTGFHRLRTRRLRGNFGRAWPWCFPACTIRAAWWFWKRSRRACPWFALTWGGRDISRRRTARW